jgi:hypothetical protein
MRLTGWDRSKTVYRMKRDLNGRKVGGQWRTTWENLVSALEPLPPLPRFGLDVYEPPPPDEAVEAREILDLLVPFCGERETVFLQGLHYGDTLEEMGKRLRLSRERVRILIERLQYLARHVYLVDPDSYGRLVSAKRMTPQKELDREVRAQKIRNARKAHEELLREHAAHKERLKRVASADSGRYLIPYLWGPRLRFQNQARPGDLLILASNSTSALGFACMTRPEAWMYCYENRDLMTWAHGNLARLAAPYLETIVLHRDDGDISLVDLLTSEDTKPGVLGERGYAR